MAEGIWLSPAQIVAINLRRARELRGMTMEEAAGVMEPFLGSRWSRATFSAAEVGSLRVGAKIRQFTADDLVAFSQTFRLPVSFFLVPPVTWEDRPVHIKRPEVDEAAALTPATLIDLIFDRPQELTDHLQNTLARIPMESRTQRQQDWSATPASVLGEVLDKLNDADQLAQTLREVADLLIEAREKHVQDIDHDIGTQAQYDDWKSQR